MIGYLSGTVKFNFGGEIILDVQGVGYRIFAAGEFETGAAAELFIHTAVSENAINLYGFRERAEFELFENLLTVTGLGTKTAAAIVAKISPAEFAAAVANQDLAALTKLPGVGKKSAQRILLELQGKLSVAQEFAPVQIRKSNALDEAAEALSALGYTDAEISTALKRAPKNLTTEQLIKFALKELNRF
ncbi:MAG: Holliday junction branch migration protein RuvA [Selenomonadaceae bacterium]|nr:Holliday junction branch migration protein RuvA [Selenomonadaceae bacterium]